MNRKQLHSDGKLASIGPWLALIAAFVIAAFSVPQLLNGLSQATGSAATSSARTVFANASVLSSEAGSKIASDQVVARPLRTKNIEDIRVGDRVKAHNPELTDEDRANAEPEPDPATWCKLTLRMTKQDGGQLDIELLRPLEWIELAEARDGGTLELEMPEMGAEGLAEVLAIDPSPPIKSGKGCIVTGTFAHSAANLIDLYVEGLEKPIGVTNDHPFWSEDRRQFVTAADLETGANLRVLVGNTGRVVSKSDRPTAEQVYNLEVAGEHVYLVTDFGILVHNSCFTGAFGDQIHRKFGKFLSNLTGAKWNATNALLKRPGVDASLLSGTIHGMSHAELKPFSASGFNTFQGQLSRWRGNGLRGGVGLFMYDAAGNIGFFGVW